MKLVSLLISALIIAIPDGEPKNGDTGAIVFTEFTSIIDAMDYVVKDILLPMDIIPLRCDTHFGYIVTERTLFKGDFNCDYVFAFFEDNGKIQIRCRPRSYDYAKTLDAFSDYSMPYNSKAMKGSPSLAYWDKFRLIVSSIPSIVVKYFGGEDEPKNNEYPF